MEPSKCLGTTVGVNGVVEADVCNRVNERCELLGGMKKIIKSRGFDMNVKGELHVRITVPTVSYGSKLCDKRVYIAERQKVNVF